MGIFMKIFLLIVLIALYTALNAAVVGHVKSVKGDVKIKNENSFKKSNVKSGMEIKGGDLISTSSSSTAVLNLVDGSILALDSGSLLHFGNDLNLNQTDGRVYYKITTRDARNALKVKTPFAIIGIKGTTFLVNATQDASVKLKEGLIGIQSIKEEFKLYRKALQDQYSEFIAKDREGFEKFKQKQNSATAEVTKEFDLQARNSVSFSQNIVSEKPFTKDDDAEFAYFEELIKLK